MNKISGRKYAPSLPWWVWRSAHACRSGKSMVDFELVLSYWEVFHFCRCHDNISKYPRPVGIFNNRNFDHASNYKNSLARHYNSKFFLQCVFVICNNSVLLFLLILSSWKSNVELKSNTYRRTQYPHALSFFVAIIKI